MLKNTGQGIVALITAAAAAVLTAAGSAWAQPAPFYLSGSYAAGLRSPAERSGAAAERGPVHSLVVAAGGALTPTVRLEASVTFETSQSLEWNQVYVSACCTKRLFSDRDVPILGLLRYAPGCRGRWCAELVVGGGINLHYSKDTVTEYCGPFGDPASCTPVSAEPDSASRAEPMIAFGVDLPIRISDRWTLGPSVRFHMIFREEYATTWDRRGPRSAGGVVPMFGVTTTWRPR